MLSLYSIYTKKVLPSVNQEVWLLSYYNNAYSIILFLPLIILNGELIALWNYENFNSSNFWAKMVIGGICGFAIGFVTSLQIKVINFRRLYFTCIFLNAFLYKRRNILCNILQNWVPTIFFSLVKNVLFIFFLISI